MDNPDYIPKHDVPVRVTLKNETHIFGVVYVRQGQRILDMLCDARRFFPIRSKDGVSVMNKSAIIKIDVMTIDDIKRNEELFPDVDLRFLKNNLW